MSSLAWPIAIIPAVRLAGRFTLADKGFATTYRGKAHALHLHDYHGRMHLADEVIAIEPGDVTISPALRRSAYDLVSAGRHWCIHFEQAEPDSAPEIVLPLRFRLGAASETVRERMAHVWRLQGRATDNGIAAASAALALQQLLLWLGQHSRPSADGSVAERAARMIDERFSEALCVPAIANAVGCSQGYLARVFRARFGITLSHHLLERRVEHAQYLLESTDLPIWRVAERVGIPDPQHFNKTVRRFLGANPTAIRARFANGASIDPDR